MAKTNRSTKQAARDRAKTPRIEAIDGQGNPEQPIADQTTDHPEAPTAVEPTPAAAKPEKAPKVLPTLEQAHATATAANPDRYASVVRVVELTKDGEPKRVVIACRDPQSKQGPDGQPISVCEGEREIAVQDLFQVECCAACADRKVRIARRNRAKRKNRALREAIKAAKAAA